MTREREKTEFGALLALLCGALSTGAAGILVRMAETGPTATAFWRGAIALPFLALWALLEPGRRTAAVDPRCVADGDQQAAGGPSGANLTTFFLSFREPGFLWAGVFFAGDLALWHWSLLLTSVAASTLEASLAPLFVTFFAWWLWRERPTVRFLAATAFALSGMVLIVSPKFGHGGSAFLGDLLGLGTAVFFAGYIVVVARLRARYGTGIVLLNSTFIYTVLLLPLALSQKFVPDTLAGWAEVAGCAIAAQVIGQGLIAYALAHLRPTFSSLGLLVQVFGAAISAWLVLGERLATIQIIGAGVIVGALAMARSARAPARDDPPPVVAQSVGVVGD